MSSWTNTTKNTASFSNTTKTSSEVIYLVSESLDTYLIGALEDLTFVTTNGIDWSNTSKS